MRRISEIFKRYSLPIFSGILIGTSYIPFPPWAVAFCYAPLWLWSLRLMQENPSPTDSKKLSMIVFRGGWWTQFVLSMIGFHWIAYVTHEFGFLPWVVAVPVLLLFAAVMHLYVPVTLWMGFWLSRKLSLKPFATMLVWAALLALGEMYWPSIFPWNMGYPLFFGKLAWAQWADVVGFQGLSFLTYALSAVIAFLWMARKAHEKRKFQVIGGILILFLALTWWGGSQKQQHWSQTDKVLQTLVVQANIGNLEKYYAEKGMGYQQYIIDQYFQLTRTGLASHPQAQMVIWPESAFPEYLDNFALSRGYPQQFLNFVREMKRPILSGAYSKDPPNIANRKDYNSIFLFNENAIAVDPPYHKTHLLVFGETLPFLDEFPWLAKINPGGAGFGRGSGATILQWNSVIFGPQVCYDSLYPDFSRSIAQKGAQILVNVTNDSWFGPYGEPYQHLYMTLGRAVEVRRPLIRSTNTGISTVVLADGSVLENSPKFQTWAGYFDVKYQSQPETTFFTRFGAWLAPMLCAILFLTLLAGRKRKSSGT